MAAHRKTQEGTALLERESVDIRPPPLYQILLLNDDFTPMEFVVQVLEVFFHMNREQATRIMLKVHVEGRAICMDHEKAMRIMLEVHTAGRGICGIYTRDIAASKVEQVVNLAREHQHPLACVMEEAP